MLVNKYYKSLLAGDDPHIPESDQLHLGSTASSNHPVRQLI